MELLTPSSNEVRLDLSRVIVDAREFDRLCLSERIEDLENAIAHRRGEFLSEVDLDVEPFEIWLQAQRRRILDLEASTLHKLVEYYAAGSQGAAAIPLAERLVSIDPLREDWQRLLLELYALHVNREKALAHSRSLSALVRSELSLDLDDSTMQLIEGIRLGRVGRQGVRAGSDVPATNGSGASSRAAASAREGTRPAAQVRRLDELTSSSRTTMSSAVSARAAAADWLVTPEGFPSIAVLPFRNAGPDPSADYLGSGLVEDIIVSLGSLQDLLVISRASTLAYQRSLADPRDVGRDLGVGYVVSGSVRRFDEQLQVFVELCDALTGEALWSDRTKIPVQGLFDLQDECVEAFATKIVPSVQRAELKRSLRKRPETFTAYDCTLQAFDLLHRNTDETFQKAGSLLQQAIEKESTYVAPYAWASWWRSIGVWQGRTSDPARSLTEATSLAQAAIELDARHALALATYGHLRSTLRFDYDAAQHYLDAALRSCPNASFAWLMSSFTQSYIGQPEQALVSAQKALRLSPLDRGRFYYLTALGVACYSAGRMDEAIEWTELSRREEPTFTANLRYYAAALAGAGQIDRARRVTAEILKQDPGFCLARYRSPFRDPGLKAEHLDRLRLAGMPE